MCACTKHNNLTLNPDKSTCTLFTPDPGKFKNIPDLKNNTTLHMANTQYSQHLSIRTHTSTNNKSFHRNRIGKTEGDTHGYLQGSHETGSRDVSSIWSHHTRSACRTLTLPTSTNSSTPDNSNITRTILHIPYTDIQQKCPDVVKPSITYNYIHMNHLTSMYIVGICFHIYCNYWFDKPLQIMG